MRLRASGVCHSDLNAIDGTAATRCPAVLGHEGAGVVEAVGDGRRRSRRARRVVLSWLPSCGRCEECLRELPHLCTDGVGRRWPPGGLLDGTPRLSRDGEPVYHYSLPVDVRRARGRAGAAAASRSPTTCRSTSPRSSAARSRPAPARSGGPPACGPGDRVARVRLRRRRPERRARRGRRRGRRPDRRRRRRAGEARGGAARSARPHAVEWAGRRRRRPPSACARSSGGGVDYAIEATGRHRGRAAPRSCPRARAAPRC